MDKDKKVLNKQKVALSSVIAAVGLTASKLVVGLLTGSLGILSEALHSLLDLFAAAITLFAVRASDKPADAEHHYGHGKVESLSAFIETALLVVTCVWIIIEAVKKLTGESPDLRGALWGALLIIVCIIVDISRSRALMKAAKQHNSQALKADALHFSTDVWSSCVVVLGLVCVWAGDTFHIEWLKYADPVAALGVAVIVLKVTYKLGRETVESLLDTAPAGMKEKVTELAGSVAGVLQVTEVRVRASGALLYVHVSAGIDPSLSQQNAHAIVHRVKESIAAEIPRSDIVVSTYPAGVGEAADAGVTSALEGIVNAAPGCGNVHNVHVYELGGRKRITAHVELSENLTLRESHELSHRISERVQAEVPGVDYVNLTFQRVQQGVETEEVTAAQGQLAGDIRAAVKELSCDVDCHDIRLFKSEGGVTAFLHCGVPEDFRMDRLEQMAGALKTGLKRRIAALEHIHIHFEPMDGE